MAAGSALVANAVKYGWREVRHDPCARRGVRFAGLVSILAVAACNGRIADVGPDASAQRSGDPPTALPAPGAPPEPPATGGGCAAPVSKVLAAHALFEGFVYSIAADATTIYVSTFASAGHTARIYALPRAGGSPRLLLQRAGENDWPTMMRAAAGSLFVLRSVGTPQPGHGWSAAALDRVDANGIVSPVPLGREGTDIFELEDFVVTPDETVFFSINHAADAGVYRAGAQGATRIIASKTTAFGLLALGTDQLFGQDNTDVGHLLAVPLTGGAEVTVGPTVGFGVAAGAGRAFVVEPRPQGSFVVAYDEVSRKVAWEIPNGWFRPLEVESDGVYVYWRDFAYYDGPSNTSTNGSTHRVKVDGTCHGTFAPSLSNISGGSSLATSDGVAYYVSEQGIVEVR
jgi:hypothetical protein